MKERLEKRSFYKKRMYGKRTMIARGADFITLRIVIAFAAFFCFKTLMPTVASAVLAVVAVLMFSTASELINSVRLDRFIAVVQHCSMSSVDIKGARDVLVKAFPGYIDNKDLTIECLEDMIKNYSDISIAWGYGSLGDQIAQIIVKNKALQLVEKTDSMQDIQMYQEMFGNKNEVSSNDNKTTVNFNLFKKG